MWIRLWIAVSMVGLSVASPLHAGGPNVLIIMADDCTHNDLAIYGGPNAKTPNIDRLASQGLVFNRAYLAEAMCQPCRAELYTGQFPMRNGCAWNHSASRPDITSMPQHLGAVGYRVGLSGKVHVRPSKVFAFKKVGGFDASCVRAPTARHDVAGIREFMSKPGDQPFCLVVALTEPHVPWVMGDASKYPVKEIELPPNIADTKETRENFGKYLAEITYMDGQVGDILAALDASGKADDTLVLFTSEQGSQFPGNKWTCWDTGVHTALVARWPSKVAAGKRTDAIVQYADVLPTLLELAGGDATKHDYDGRSFATVLSGKSDTHRDYAFGIHNQIPEGPPYPVRTVTDGRFRYIRNLRPDDIFIEKHLMGLLGGSVKYNAYWTSWPREAVNNEHTYAMVKRYMHRPAEELYDTANDPYEMTNLIGEPKHAAVKTNLVAQLERWMTQQGDPGIPVDTKDAIQAAKKGKHKYGPGDTK